LCDDNATSIRIDDCLVSKMSTVDSVVKFPRFKIVRASTVTLVRLRKHTVAAGGGGRSCRQGHVSLCLSP
jgi:hypothetical protein